MTNHFYLGGINTKTNKMEPSYIALKTNNYKCPECDNDIILKKGKIKKAHFSHKANSNCCFYDRQGETATHWNAKYMMKNKMEHKDPLTFFCKCNNCSNGRTTVIQYNKFSTPIVEYRYSQQHSTNYWIADVALLTGNNIDNIIEIIHTSKTDEWKRDGYKWVEVKAEDVNMETNTYVCQRVYTCDDCLECMQKLELERQKREMERQTRELERQNLKKECELERQKLEQERELERQNLKKERELERQKLEQEREMEREIKRQKLEQERELERQERKLERKLQLKSQKEEEEYIKHNRAECKCGIQNQCICKCANPKYELVKICNELWCYNCNKWKCRCIL